MAKKKVVYDFKEEFIKADNAATENNQIEVMLEELLEKNKDNEVLQEYLALQKKLEDNNIIYLQPKEEIPWEDDEITS